MCNNGERTIKKVCNSQRNYQEININELNLEDNKDLVHGYNLLFQSFELTKSVVSLSAKDKHDYIDNLKNVTNFTSYFKCTNTEICKFNNMTTMSHVMAKIRAKSTTHSKAHEDKQLKKQFIVFAYEMTNNGMGVIKFRDFLNQFVANYKINPTKLYQEIKDPNNPQNIHLQKLCDFIEQNPRVLNMHFGAHTIRAVLRDCKKFYTKTNRT